MVSILSGRLLFQVRIWVLHLGRVSGARAGIELTEHRVIQRVRLEPGHFAAGRVQVAENNRLGRTGLLASRSHLALANAAVLLLGTNARGADSLDAIGAFFH